MSLVATEIKFAAVSATVDGDNTVVAAVAGKKIRVISYNLCARAAGLVTFKSSTTSTLGTLDLLAQTPAEFGGGARAPAFETVAGELLNFNVAAGVDVLGHLAYVLV